MEKGDVPIAATSVSSSLSNLLVIFLMSILCIWCIQYHWKRRKLYATAATTEGPLALPLIGCALEFFGSPVGLYKSTLRMGTYKSPSRVWLGSSLHFYVFEPKQLEIILNNPHAVEKNELYKFVRDLGGTGLVTASSSTWRHHRKIIQPTFNQKILNGYVEIFTEQANILLQQLEKNIGNGEFDIIDYLYRYSMDAICESAMGIQTNEQTTESEFVQWVTKSLEAMFRRTYNVHYFFDFIYNRTKLAREQRYYIEKIQEFTDNVIRDKLIAYQIKRREDAENPESYYIDESTKRNSFIEQLVQYSEDAGMLTVSDVRDEVITFMAAGSETTATAIAYVVMILGMYPDIQDRVYEEAMDLLGPDRAIEWEDLGKLSYLERVIKETVRIFPVAPMIGRLVTKDVELADFTLPAGSNVIIMLTILHRNPKIWRDPFKFDPDRFLPEEIAKRHSYSWLPFMGGARNCIGYKYAMMSMKTVIATMIRKYRLHCEYKHIEDIELKIELILKPVHGYRVSLDLRQ